MGYLLVWQDDFYNKTIINNIFEEQARRRYLNSLGKTSAISKFAFYNYKSTPPLKILNPNLGSISISSIYQGTLLGFLLLGSFTVCSLIMFQYAERRKINSKFSDYIETTSYKVNE